MNEPWTIWPRETGLPNGFPVCPLCGVAVAKPELHITYHQQRNETIPVLDPNVLWGNKKP